MATGIGAETKIRFADGTAHRIKDIVEQHIKGSVYTYDLNKNQIETHPIIGWHKTDNILPLDNWKHVMAAGYDTTGGFLGATLTKDLSVYISENKAMPVSSIPASTSETVEHNISPYHLMTYIHSVVNGTFSDFLFSLLAGQTARLHIKNKRTAEIVLAPIANRDYFNWLINNQFKGKMKFTANRRTIKNRNYHTAGTSELALIANQVNGDYSSYFLDHHFSMQGFALWVLSSGIYNADKYSDVLDPDVDFALIANQKNMYKLINALYLKLDLESEAISIRNKNLLIFNQKNTEKLLRLVSDYLPEPLIDLVPAWARKDTYDWHTENKPGLKIVPTELLELRPGAMKQMRDAHVYSLDIADSDNMFIGSVDNGILIKLNNNQII